MEINNLPSNSHKYNLAKQEPENVKPKEIRKVTTGKVITKKRSIGKRFVDLFISEDIGDVKEYLIMDVLVPALKDGFVDMCQKGIEMLFYGKVKSRPSNGSYVSYSGYSQGKKHSEPVRRSIYSYDDIILNDRPEAEDVLAMLNEMVEKYDQVTVADFYDIVGVSRPAGSHYTDEYYGWKNLEGAYISKCREGYLINLPRCYDLR